MRILHIITSLHTGGAEKLLVDLLPLLNTREVTVDLLLLNGEETPFWEQLKKSGVKIFTSQQGLSVYNLRHIFLIRRMIRKYDIVHTHNYSPQLFAAIGSIGIPVKLITTEHSTSNRRRGNILFRLLDIWMYSRYDRIICISEQVDKHLRHHLKWDDERIIVIHNGINLERYASALELEEMVREYATYKRVCMVAGFRPAKDHETLIKAFACLPNDYILFLVGVGETMDGCQKMVENLGLSKRIHFWGVRTDIPEIMKSISCLVLSSHWEGFGLVAIEGMSAGVPVIVSNVSGLSEVVGDGAVLFPKGQHKCLAEAIRNLCENESFRQNKIEKGRLKAQKYDIKEMVRAYNLTYNTVMN